MFWWEGAAWAEVTRTEDQGAVEGITETNEAGWREWR